MWWFLEAVASLHSFKMWFNFTSVESCPTHAASTSSSRHIAHRRSGNIAHGGVHIPDGHPRRYFDRSGWAIANPNPQTREVPAKGDPVLDLAGHRLYSFEYEQDRPFRTPLVELFSHSRLELDRIQIRRRNPGVGLEIGSQFQAAAWFLSRWTSVYKNTPHQNYGL